ncbi:unnamed protein product [Malus baccata var. baccata]
MLESALYSGGNQKTLQPSSRISLWKVTSSKAKVSHIISSPFASPYPCCCLRHKEKENNQPEAKVEPLIQSALIVERDSGIALHHLQMSEFGGPSDGGSPNSNSRFELAMFESSGPLLESCTKNSRLGDLRNLQALANIGSSSFMSVGEGVVCDAIPIFRYKFIVDHLVQNLLDSEKQLGALRQSCSIPRSVGIRLVHHEELSFEPPKGHVMGETAFAPVLQQMLSFIGYAPGQLYPGCWDTLIEFYIIWMECGLVIQGTIKLSGRELANVEKVLRVPKEDRHLGKLRPLFESTVSSPYCRSAKDEQKVGKKGETNAKKGKTSMLVPVDDILFHKGARKYRVRPTPKPKSQEEVLKIATSKKAKAEAIGCTAAIVAGEERRLLPPLPTINPIFPPTMQSTDQEGGPSCSRKRKYKEEVGRRSIINELGEPLDENKSDRDRMMRLSSYVMTEYDDRLREVERYKAKFKKNKQLVNDARKMSKALADAICLKDENFESLKRQKGENMRLKKQLEATKEQLETTILKVSKVKGELDSALVEVSWLKRSILIKRDDVVQEFLGSQAFHDAFRPRCIRVANFEKRKWMAVLERYDNGSIIQKYRDEMDEYR